MRLYHSLSAALIVAFASATLVAQVQSESSASAALSAATKFRAEISDGIVLGKLKAESAISRLESEPSPSGLQFERGADAAMAAIDVGQRLIVLHQPTDAEKFFLYAERQLVPAVQRTPDSSSREKALLLRKLALIRGNYLNKVAEARKDIEQAIQLQPDDKALQRAKALLPNDASLVAQSKKN